VRIGLFSDILTTDPWSGIGNYVRYLVREWSREHEVWALGARGGNPEAGFAGSVRMAAWNWRWRRQVEKFVDVVHCPLTQIPDRFYRLNRPRVVTIHGAAAFLFPGTTTTEAPTPSMLRLRKEHEALDLFLTVSRSAQAEISEHYGIPPERILPIYHGVDTEIFFPAPDKEAARRRACTRFGIPGPYLLHVSKYRPKKNGARIVAAYRRLWREGFREISLVLAGTVRRGFAAVAEEIERGDGGRIVRLGQLQGRELAELYQGAEVFLFPSLHESFGLPPLESMACGVPVVVSNVFSLPEVVGEAGEKVNPESVEEIAAATAPLLRNPALRAERSRAALARSREFRWDICARKHIEAFERAREAFAVRKRERN